MIISIDVSKQSLILIFLDARNAMFHYVKKNVHYLQHIYLNAIPFPVQTRQIPKTIKKSLAITISSPHSDFC